MSSDLRDELERAMPGVPAALDAAGCPPLRLTVGMRLDEVGWKIQDHYNEHVAGLRVALDAANGQLAREIERVADLTVQLDERDQQLARTVANAVERQQELRQARFERDQAANQTSMVTIRNENQRHTIERLQARVRELEEDLRMEAAVSHDLGEHLEVTEDELNRVRAQRGFPGYQPASESDERAFQTMGQIAREAAGMAALPITVKDGPELRNMLDEVRAEQRAREDRLAFNRFAEPASLEALPVALDECPDFDAILQGFNSTPPDAALADKLKAIFKPQPGVYSTTLKASIDPVTPTSPIVWFGDPHPAAAGGVITVDAIQRAISLIKQPQPLTPPTIIVSAAEKERYAAFLDELRRCKPFTDFTLDSRGRRWRRRYAVRRRLARWLHR